jgi:peptide/nickel transport system substrate-binding protein
MNRPAAVNGWQGRNFTRYSDPEADAIYKQAKTELDPVKRTAMLVRINEIFCEAHVVLPLFSRSRLSACANNIDAKPSSWDVDTWDLASWYRT